MREEKQGKLIRGSRKYLFLLPALVLILSGAMSRIGASALGAEKWPGVDETVVEKIALEHGREAKTAFFDAAQGDMLLFLFLLAGGVAGFAGGYYWRMLVSERKGTAVPGDTERGKV
ncbi:cobalt/nickel transport protein [Geobacter sp. DSM 9736]|nr:cobalt transporter [Geobacter sp. DSM 9736]SNB46985.1 cobalt/nickel transport protein [Geobacter sp. DSM 9736]